MRERRFSTTLNDPKSGPIRFTELERGRCIPYYMMKNHVPHNSPLKFELYSIFYTHDSTSADWQSVARRVIVLTNKEIQALFIRYPEGINKEVFRKTCHISPRMAQYLLESQLVPCEIKAQRTHRYWIATADMVAYLRDREKHPERYFYPSQRGNGEHEPNRKHRRMKDRP